MSFELTVLNNSALLEKAAVRDILECNYISGVYGLALSESEARELVEVASDSLKASGRVQLGGGILDKLIAVFSASSYLTAQNYSETLQELVGIFYEYKNEFPQDVSDSELVEMMYKTFEERSGGSLEKLAGDCLAEMARNMRAGLPADYTEPIQLDEDEIY